MARILFVITEDWALLSHRFHLIKEAVARGDEVGLATRFSSHEQIISSFGVKTFEWGLVRNSTGLVREFNSIIRLNEIIEKFKPDLIHAVAQKPVIYSGIVRLFRRDFVLVAALGGLGYVFYSKKTKGKILKIIISFLLKIVLSNRKTKLILQNMDNISTFESLGIIKSSNVALIKGSGVEVDQFVPTPLPKGKPIIILPARLLWDKGVKEFVEAAKSIKAQKIEADFILVGSVDPHNESSISQAQIDIWVFENLVKHYHRVEDMVEVYKYCSIVCLPSYHEGMPKVLLEAASCARPVIGFDVPGTREFIVNGQNGYLVPFKNQNKLEFCLKTLITNKKMCTRMGKVGRNLVEKIYSDKIINKKTFEIYDGLLK